MVNNSETKSSTKRDQPVIQAIANAVDTIDFISKSSRGVGVRELARELRLTRGTAERVLYTLTNYGFLRRDEELGRYFIGQRILEIALQHQQSISIGKAAHHHMSALMRDCGETVFLGVMDRDHVTIVDRVDSPHPLRMAATLGVREPLVCTALGKIIMAHLSEATCQELISGFEFECFTPNTLMTADEVLESVRQSRQQGWAIDDEEFHEGVRCIAAAIFDYVPKVVGAVSVSGPIQRIGDNKLPEISARVIATATAISKDLGYVPKT